MNATPDRSEKAATLWKWLDAVAKETTPLPSNPTIARIQRYFHVARVILAWMLTMLMLQVLGGGMVLASILFTSEGIAVGFGLYFWFVTGAIVAVSGTLALICLGRFVECLYYLVCSPLTSLGFTFAQIALAEISPVLVIPPAVVLNCVYFYVAWRFMLSSPSAKTALA